MRQLQALVALMVGSGLAAAMAGCEAGPSQPGDGTAAGAPVGALAPAATERVGALELHYVSPTRTTITLATGDSRDLGVTVDVAGGEYALDVYEGMTPIYGDRGLVRAGEGADSLSQHLGNAAPARIAALRDALNAAFATPESGEPGLSAQGRNAVALARVTLGRITTPLVRPQLDSTDSSYCIPHGCIGACGAGCSPTTCDCEMQSPPAFVSCNGTSGVYKAIYSYNCYTAPCCQDHDYCLGSNSAYCVTPTCLGCDAVAAAEGCASCAGNGSVGCARSGGTYEWYDPNPIISLVPNDPACSCDGMGGQPNACGVCDGPTGGCDGCGGANDACGVCDGDGSTCSTADDGGCDGYGGTYDDCGVCDGDGSSCGGGGGCDDGSDCVDGACDDGSDCGDMAAARVGKRSAARRRLPR